MKRYIAIAVILIGMSVSSCSDFFDTHSPSTTGSEDVFTNEQNTASAIAAIYEQFGADKSYRNRLACGYQGLNTDIEKCTKDVAHATYSMGNSYSELSQAEGKDPWGYFNTIIERSSLVIEGIEEYADLSKPAFSYYLGEALFLRSFAYLEMVKLWGDVPPRFVSLSKDPEGMSIKKDDRNKIYEQLRIDLSRAAELLPWSAECPGLINNSTERPTKAAALALLARSDLMYAGYALRPNYMQEGGGAPYKVQLNTQDAIKRQQLYQEVLEACAKIIGNTNEDKKLLSNYEQIFKNICADVTDYSKSEVIWEIPFADGQRGQVLQYNASSLKYAQNALKNNGTATANSIVSVTPTFYFTFDQNDARREVTMLPYQWNYDDATGVASDATYRETIMPGTAGDAKKLYQKYQGAETWYLGKYRVEWMVRERTSGEDGINFPIMRYADVLLMFAEASIGGITGDAPANNTGLDGQAMFDRVRARAGLGSVPLTMDAIINERAWEFCGEYIRKYDLMRWGILKERLTAATAAMDLFATHQGAYAGLNKSVYFKYKTSPEINDYYLYKGEGALASAAYILDSIYGLNPGETGEPATFSKETGWVEKSMFDGEKLIPTKWFLYAEEDMIDKRHYWPIFLSNVGSSNGTLWNDYDY